MRRWCARAGSATLLVVTSLGCGAAGPDPEEQRRARADYELGSDAFQRGRYREALAHAQKALERDEESAEAAYLAAMTYFVFCANDESSPDCRYEEAEKHLRRAVEADPNARDARNALGVVLIHRRRLEEAAGVLEPLAHDILYRSPEKAWGNLGWAYLEAGRHDAAVEALKRAVAAQPLFCVGHFRLGLAYEKKADHAAARQAFSRAVGIQEGGCSRLQAAYWGRARVEKHLGLVAEVRKDLERCRELTMETPIGRSCDKELQGLK
jgi:Tfp pilus assembly protein PilF